MLYTYFIFRYNMLKKELTDQKNDAHVFGWLLRNQSNSCQRALTIEGWKIEVKNQETGLVTDYLTSKPIADPLCNK